MIDAYIKRFKSVFLPAFVALLVGLSLAGSRSGLTDAHLQAKRWYWVGLALTAEVGDGSGIVSIGDVSEPTWRERHPDRPMYGKVLDVVRNLTETEAVAGRISAPDRRVLHFHATPLREGDPHCSRIPGFVLLHCSRYVFSQDDADKEVVYFVYQEATSGDTTWLALDHESSRLLDFTAAEDRVLGLTEPWIGKRGSASVAFDALVEKLNSQTIKLPVLNLDLPARLASTALAFFALVSSYLAATSLAGLERCYDASGQREPWIMRHQSSVEGDWTRLVGVGLASISRFAGFAQVWLPSLLLAVAIRLSPSNSINFLVAVCAVPSLILMVFSTRIFKSLLRRMD